MEARRLTTANSENPIGQRVLSSCIRKAGIGEMTTLPTTDDLYRNGTPGNPNICIRWAYQMIEMYNVGNLTARNRVMDELSNAGWKPDEIGTTTRVCCHRIFFQRDGFDGDGKEFKSAPTQPSCNLEPRNNDRASIDTYVLAL